MAGGEINIAEETSKARRGGEKRKLASTSLAIKLVPSEKRTPGRKVIVHRVAS